ncbi:HEAT repeat protein [Seiridium cupressi]
MDATVAREPYPGLQEATFNPRSAVTWIEQKPTTAQVSYANDIFEELLQTAAKPKQSSGHACVKLCGFVEQCSRSQSSTVREYAFSQQTADVLFNFYVEWNEQDQHRSMRLVLDFLKTTTLKNLQPQIGTAIKTRLLADIVSFITLKSVKPAVKSAFTALDYFLQKGVFYLSQVIGTYQIVHNTSEEQHESWDKFISRIFHWMQMKHICPIAGKLLATIFSGPWLENESTRFLPDSWHRFLCIGLDADIELLEPIQIYTLVPLFTSDKEQMLKYLDLLSSLQSLTKDQSNLDTTSIIWLAALEAGKKVGVVGEPLTGNLSSDSVTHLQKDTLEDILSHSSQEARSSAVSILIASPSTTKPYAIASLELLQTHLPAFHADGDAKFRYDVLGYSRNMITRILGAIAGINRDIDRKVKKTKNDVKGSGSEEITELRHLLQRHKNFLSWYFDFLKNELIPTASYQRHITALKAMEFILKSRLHANQDVTDSDGNLSLVDAVWLRSVLDLIMDPFDDVRETAASLLVLLSSEGSQKAVSGLSKPMLQELEEFCARASKLASRTSRADHSDGVARSYEIVCRWTTSGHGKLAISARILADIEAKLLAAETNLADAVLEAPIHGGFAALRYVWQSLSSTKYSVEDLQVLASLQSRAVSSCQRIWQVVRLVLCDDSPEGHLPEELEEVDELDTKDLLSYSFRAIHESSHLLRIIASNVRSNQAGLIKPTYDEFETIGNLTFEQLSNLRHRGAFTTVSQTFTSCCQLVKYSAVSSGNSSALLPTWYKGALDCIYTQASTTRRSAGIPALIVGILSSNTDDPAFHTVMQSLQDIAQEPARITETDGSNLPQVHATNCIKDIFKSSLLSRRAEPYLTDCLQLAANSLKSEIWAIRNCGLILLRSLIDCLFGTSESKTSMEAGWDGRTTRVAWHKYKSLPVLLVNLLKSTQNTTEVSKEMTTAESVFPALDIIRRAGPPQEFKDELYGIVAWYIGSHFWHVREIAARTLCSFLLHADWFENIRTLLTESRTSANKLHGALLTFKFLLERLLDTMPDQLFKHYPDDMFDLIHEISQTPASFQTCAEARAVYFEIISFLNTMTSNKRSNNSTPEIGLIEVGYSCSPSCPDVRSRAIPLALMESKQAQAYAAYEMEQTLSLAGSHSNLDMQALLNSDINVACDVLQTILVNVEAGMDSISSTDAAPQVVELCLTTLRETDAAEPRAVALDILTAVLDGIAKNKAAGSLPTRDALTSLWTELQSKPLNPSLADAVIRTSGPLIKALVTQSQDAPDQNTEQWLRSWGVMMSNAGSIDNGFDTRMAGIQAILSFTSNSSLPFQSPANLSWLLALYDYLNDDDDEIRDIAASATAPILGKPLVSIEASTRLLSWLAKQYGETAEFRTHVACRMVGQPAVWAQITDPTRILSSWDAAEADLARAMRFDDSLFVVEEQNLYIDEVRESLRWKDVFRSLAYAGDDDAAVAALLQWTTAGLRTLCAQAETDDGVLGWTSKPEVFALCSRVVVCGVALAEKHADAKEELRTFVEQGKKTRVHGLLLGLCGGR